MNLYYTTLRYHVKMDCNLKDYTRILGRNYVFKCTKEYMKVKTVSRLCLTLCDPMDCSLPGSSVHGILQARLLEWVAIPFSRASSWPRDQIWISGIIGRFFTVWAARKAKEIYQIRSDQISRSVVSDSLQPHELQQARPPCPSPTPGVHSDPCPSSQWCHPAISSSVVPFFSCP